MSAFDPKRTSRRRRDCVGAIDDAIGILGAVTELPLTPDQTAFKSCTDYWSSLIPRLRTSGVQRATSSDMNSLNRSAVQSGKGSTAASIRDC
jgi:hypothetical protein